MRLLFSKSASPHHGFAAYYTYLEKIFKADAVLHFGTHGSLEFMPGKQVGMSGACYPDRLINSIPNIYYYAANNPSEATIAKRRSYAATISYLTPPAENAGLYKVRLFVLGPAVLAFFQSTPWLYGSHGRSLLVWRQMSSYALLSCGCSLLLLVCTGRGFWVPPEVGPPLLDQLGFDRLVECSWKISSSRRLSGWQQKQACGTSQVTEPGVSAAARTDVGPPSHGTHNCARSLECHLLELFDCDFMYVPSLPIHRPLCSRHQPNLRPLYVRLSVSFPQGLKELNELVSSYQGLRENGARGPSIVSASIACARTCNLDKDIKDLPSDDTDTKLMTLEVGIHALYFSALLTV